MDRQQRCLLETTCKALESGELPRKWALPSMFWSIKAGVTVSRISNTSASVSTGNFTNDYLLLASKDPETMPKYCSTGVAGAMLSNRISTIFNLSGPSITIDTACSSSLVALDMAFQSLRQGESSLVNGGLVVCEGHSLTLVDHCHGVQSHIFPRPHHRTIEHGVSLPRRCMP